MKAVNYSDELRNNPHLLKLTERATNWLEDAIGTAAIRVTANWGYFLDDKGQPGVRLEVSDWSGSNYSYFTVAELEKERDVQMRFLRQWGDLLESGSHRLIDNMRNNPVQTVEG